MRKSLFGLLILAFTLAPIGELQGQSDPGLATGIHQVGEGDFEAALSTLEGVIGRLTGDPARSKDLAQALLYLGVAHVALGQVDPARTRFREALAHDPRLRLGPDRFSPKVIAVFEAARREAQAAQPASGKPGSKTPLILLSVGAAAAGVTVVAVARGRDSSSGGTPTFANARFGTPVIVCPDGSRGVPVPFQIVLDGTNGGSSPVRIDSVTTTLIIKTSSIPSEIDFASSLPSVVSPRASGARPRHS